VSRPVRQGLAALAAATALLLALPATAGQTCEAAPLGVTQASAAFTLAERTAQALNASGAEVVLLARVGQDLSAHGVRWSHLGFAVRERPGAPWRVVHKLNACGSAEASLYRQGLAEFFLDNLHAYEAGFVVPTAAVQAQLKPILLDNGRAAWVHTPRYNMLAYPWSMTSQQSNQWALETLAASQLPAPWTGGFAARERAQAWLRVQNYQPATIRLSTATRLGASVSRSNIDFNDHPPARRFAGKIDTVTVESVFDFLQRSGFAGPLQIVR
jgi:hypothetical protein